MKKSLGAKTLVYPTPVYIVGTYDEAGKPNLMNAAWGGVCCSSPPCVAVSLRKATYTYNNLMQKKAFTVNIPSEEYFKEADYFGLASGRDTDKFAVTGLTPVRSQLVDAPYVEEFSLVLECKVIHVLEIGLHTQFVGEILDVKAEEAVLGEKELPDLSKVKPFIFAPVTGYYYRTADKLGKAFSVGKELEKK